MKLYRIHPGVGIARVGRSERDFFLAPERTDGDPFTLAGGSDIPIDSYKDKNYLIKRQGARFRVYEYERGVDGTETLLGEVTPARARIVWSVTLGNRKASGPFMVSVRNRSGERIVVPDKITLRNSAIKDRASLQASVTYGGLSGINKRAPAKLGRIRNMNVYLGEAFTDYSGRLVVLGGWGRAMCWRKAEINDYLNNDRWFDDVADGPVDAELHFADGSKRGVDSGSWIIVAPPDFAPAVAPVTSLFDVMHNAITGGQFVGPPSFVDDVLPLIQRAASLRWVSDKISNWQALGEVLKDVRALADSTARADALRRSVSDILLDAENALSQFRFTTVQRTVVERWADGNFLSDFGKASSVGSEPHELDRSALSRCIGGGFFPGIEMGATSTLPTLWSGSCRFTRNRFQDWHGTSLLEPGSVTERMAVPWHADFVECTQFWWPAQRPDSPVYRSNGMRFASDTQWDRGVATTLARTSVRDHKNMVDRFAQLGLVDTRKLEDGSVIFAEIGRSPKLTDG